MTLLIYTDGGAYPNPGGFGGWAAVFVRDGVPEREPLSGSAVNTTNNRMELTAAIEALRAVEPSEDDVIVVSDSMMLVNGYGVWRFKWELKKWHKVKNVDLWQELIEVASRHRFLQFVWVRGHQGEEWNEKADALATIQRLAREKEGV